MATVLQPIVNELNTVLVQLRIELRGLQTDADGPGIAIVMGPAVVAGKQTPADLQHRVNADALLGGVTIEQNDMIVYSTKERAQIDGRLLRAGGSGRYCGVVVPHCIKLPSPDPIESASNDCGTRLD